MGQYEEHRGHKRGASGDGAEDKKRARLDKLAAWKQKKEAGADTAAPPPSKSASQSAAWLPWEDPGTAFRAAATHVPPEIAARQAAAAANLAAETFRREEEIGNEDPRDAFMAAEVAPEVKAKEAAELAEKEAVRQKLAADLAAGKKPAALPKDMDESDSEEEADVEIEIPEHKVKLMIGAGGDKIKYIQRKSKCRIQIRKDEKEMKKAWGSGPTLPTLKGPPSAAKPAKNTTIMLFGNAKECEVARRMIEEAVDNREQKQKQREKEYAKKKEGKWREKQLYHLRHAHDYETLEVPLGTPKADCKVAYRKLAKKWHPDKYRGSEDKEHASQKFQQIQRAFDNLMSTDEDATIYAINK